MKTLKNLLLVTVMCLAVYSCKKDKEAAPEDSIFANETIDQGKANIEFAGQAMVAEMKAMNSLTTSDVLESFEKCNENDDPFETATIKSTPVFRTISTASALSSGKSNLSDLSKLMQLDIQEDTTFSQIYNKYKATYTWDSLNKVWIKSASSDFKFIFPSVVNGTTNDAMLTITYQGKTGLYPVDDYNGDLPESFNASIVVNAKTVFEIDLQASYNEDGVPETVNYFVALYPYKYAINITCASSMLTLRYTLTNDNREIINFYGRVEGNFSKSNINNMISNENAEPDDMIYGGNALFQVFNIELDGNVDFQKLYNAKKAIDDKDITAFEADSAFAKELNTYMKLDLIYADSRKKIATTEAYPFKHTDIYYYLGNKYTKVDSEIGLRFIFKDGSPINMDVYFNAGFGDLVNDLNEFIIDLNYDYEQDIDPIDYE